MLRPGDRVAVGVSGGKDSLCLLDALLAYRTRAPFAYDVVAVTIEQGKFKSGIRALEPHIARLGVEWIVSDEPATLALVKGMPPGCGDHVNAFCRGDSNQCDLFYTAAAFPGSGLLKLSITVALLLSRCTCSWHARATPRQGRAVSLARWRAP